MANTSLRGLLVAGTLVLLIAGCGKQKDSDAQAAAGDKKEQVESIFSAFNDRDFDNAERQIVAFLSHFPDDEKEPSFRLMLADLQYEQEKYPKAYSSYRAFAQRYPAHEKAEYSEYKSAHAKFAQANHVTCDATPTEETVRHCEQYLAREDFTQYRRQMENLQRTCQQRLVDKELYVANSYLNQDRLASARNRLEYVRENFDVAMNNAEDKVLFYEAKLAKQEGDSELLNELVGSMHEDHADSHFTAMADRLNSDGLFS